MKTGFLKKSQSTVQNTRRIFYPYPDVGLQFSCGYVPDRNFS